MRVLNDDEREYLSQPDGYVPSDENDELEDEQGARVGDALEARDRVVTVSRENDEFVWTIRVNTRWGNKALRVDAIIRGGAT